MVDTSPEIPVLVEPAHQLGPLCQVGIVFAGNTWRALGFSRAQRAVRCQLVTLVGLFSHSLILLSLGFFILKMATVIVPVLDLLKSLTEL